MMVTMPWFVVFALVFVVSIAVMVMVVATLPVPAFFLDDNRPRHGRD